MSKLQYLKADTSAETIAAVLKSDGALILEDVISPAELAQLKSEIMPYVEATAPGGDEFSGHQTTRTGALVARSGACRKMVMNGPVLEAARGFLEPYCGTIQLHLTQLIQIKPGQKRQVLHRDRLAWGGYLPADLEPQFNTIWAVTDFTQENGATQVVPGSNLWDPKRTPDKTEIQYAEMKAGSVLIYSGSVIHGGGANVSNTERMGLNIGYSLAWLRQEENQYLSCPPHIAKDFEPELQELLGYAMGSFALGYFTPPLPVGEGPEVISPRFLFDGKVKDWQSNLYEKTAAKAADGGM